tara:strand:+ start:1418 stop:1828 length:411 start_codon:yes stop_codon:yes gene_type:complete
LNHKFVEFIPEQIQENTIYISTEYSTAVHKCCCGCGIEVVTPFSPTDWKLIFDGNSITLSPSIGNWNFDCRSHYFIRNNKVRWAGSWTDEEIEQGRDDDRESKEAYYNKPNYSEDTYIKKGSRKGRWNLWKWLFRK